MSIMQSRAALPQILVLGTGGTIAGVATAAATAAEYKAGVLDATTLLAAAPGIESLAQLHVEQLCSVDSKDMTFAVWQRLARRVAEWLAQPHAAGCVVTHGTDTLEETAYLLHCVLPADKPVVLTGAMLPATALSADGPRNLYDAVQVAASPTAAGRGVLCVMHGRIHGAVDVAKVGSGVLDAFGSSERGPLGFVGARGVRFLREQPLQVPPLPLPRGSAWPRVEVVGSHAGADGALVRALLAASQRGEVRPPLAGLVVLGTGGGTVHEALQVALDAAVAAGVRVVYASRIGPLWTGEGDGLNGYKLRVRLMLELAAARA